MNVLHGRRIDDDTVEVTLAHAGGLTTLQGQPQEIAALATAMQEVAVLAEAADEPTDWLSDVVVGQKVVQLRIAAAGQAQLRVAEAA